MKICSVVSRGWRAGLLMMLTIAVGAIGEELPERESISAEQFEKFIEEAMKRYQVPGASVTVVKDGKSVLVKGFGFRDLETAAPVDADTIFHLASVSKVLTAMAAGAVADAGKLGWDQPVVEVLPGLRLMDEHATQDVTLRDLLTHRTGLVSYGFPPYWRHLFPREELLKRLRFIHPAYSFRDHAEYSNIGYFLAGEAAAAAWGSTYEKLLSESVLVPVGMSRSGYWGDFDEDKNVSRQYRVVDGQAKAVEVSMPDTYASSSGLSSTANDLAKMMNVLLAKGKSGDRQVLKEETVETMFSPVLASQMDFAAVPPIGADTGFFFSPGWNVYYSGNRRVVEKSGALEGIRASVMLVPEEELGVAVLANLHLTTFPEAVRTKVLLEAVEGANGEKEDGESKQLQERIFQQGGEIAKILANKPKPPSDGHPPRYVPVNYAGVYVSDLFGKWTIKVDAEAKGEFVLNVGTESGQWSGVLRGWDGDTLMFDWPGALTWPDLAVFRF